MYIVLPFDSFGNIELSNIDIFEEKTDAVFYAEALIAPSLNEAQVTFLNAKGTNFYKEGPKRTRTQKYRIIERST